MPLHFLTKHVRSIAHLRRSKSRAPVPIRSHAARRKDGSAADPLSTHAIGTFHRIFLQRPTEESDYLLILSLEPSEPHCHLVVSVNATRQRPRLLHMRSVICHNIAWSFLAEGSMIEVAFDTTETVDPVAGAILSVKDVSLLKYSPPGPSLRPIVGVASKKLPSRPDLLASDKVLLSQFVSLGDNCEFGLYQRWHGVDRPSLLRFATVPIHGLVLALEERFEACYDPNNFYFQLPKHSNGVQEYILCHERYGFLWHTWIDEAEATGPEMIEREYRKICMLIRMLIESLDSGGRILVYKCNVALEHQDRARLAQLLSTYGRNGLLIVAPASRKQDVGRVELTNGVMIGYIDKFLPYDGADRRSSEAWMTICRNAYECWHKHEGNLLSSSDSHSDASER